MTIYSGPEAFEDQTPSLAQSLGTSLGAPIGSGLRMLLNYKMQEMAKQKQSERLAELLHGTAAPSTMQIEGEVERGPIGEGGDISDEAIAMVTQSDPNLARVLQSQKESKIRHTEAKAKREMQRALPFLKRVDERSEILPQKESSLHLMEDAAKEGDLSYFSPDNIAEITGVEAFRTPKGAQFISAGKEYFLGSLKRAGTRPNQWIEQQIQKMLPKIGRSRKANLTVIETLKSELEVEKKQMDLIEEIAAEDEAKYGYIRGNIAGEVRKRLKKFADEEQKDLLKRLRAIDKGENVGPEEVTKEEILMIDPAGNIRKLRKSDRNAAIKEGYKLYK